MDSTISTSERNLAGDIKHSRKCFPFEKISEDKLKKLVGVVSLRCDNELIRVGEEPDVIRVWWCQYIKDHNDDLSVDLEDYINSRNEEYKRNKPTESKKSDKFLYKPRDEGYELIILLEESKKYDESMSSPGTGELYFDHCGIFALIYLDSEKLIKADYMKSNYTSFVDPFHSYSDSGRDSIWPPKNIEGSMTIKDVIIKNPCSIKSLGEVFGYDVLIKSI